MAEETKRCGECAYWMTPRCTYFEDAKKGIVRPTDVVCNDFYPLPTRKRERKKRERRPPHKTSGIAEEGPFEAIYYDNKPAFLVKAEDGFKILESVTNQGKTVLPKEFNEMPYEPYGYVDAPIPSREELFWRIHNEFDVFLDVESIWKDFLAACVLLSYHQEKVRTVPYAYLYGDTESGKTTAFNLLQMLCYRPLFGVTIPAADIYGYLDDVDSPSTILEDEAQGFWKDLDKSKVYKAGYKAGAVVPRYYVTPLGRFIKYYRCFCFKACAAEQMPRVKGLKERFIFIQMVEGFPKKEWADIDDEDLKRFRELRDTLLKWRLATRYENLPIVNLPVKGRLKELWKPVIQIVSGLTVESKLTQFLKHLQEERRSELIDTLEGHIVKVVTELYEKNKPIPFVDIWDALVVDLQGKLDDKKPHKMDTPEFGDVTKQKVGYRLREVLNGKKITLRTPEGNVKAYKFDDDKVRRIAKKYGYALHTKLPSSPSFQGPTTPKTMEKPMINNVEKTMKEPQELGELSVQSQTRCAKDKPALGDVVSKLRAEWTEDLTDEEILERLVQLGLTPMEAKDFFEDRLAGIELFWYDKDGKTVWKWA